MFSKKQGKKPIKKSLPKNKILLNNKIKKQEKTFGSKISIGICLPKVI